MRGARIPHDLNGEDQFVLGLSVPRLAALLLGLLAAYTILHLSLPAPVQLVLAALAAALGAAVAWVRPEGRSLIHWLIAAIEFKVGERFPVDSHPLRETENVPRSLGAMAAQADVPADSTETRSRKPSLQVITAIVTSAQSSAPRSTTIDRDGVIELPDNEPGSGLREGPLEKGLAIPAPVYLGGPQVITFFSAKGGTGRTTLATEVASLLALKGYYRDAPSGSPQRLRVVLIDFDLASANVSSRLGLAQPTMLDYLCDSSVQNPDPRDFIVHHPATSLDVLLGPSKCLAGDRAELMGVAQAAHILSTFKGAGYQYLILDISASLGDLETYLLEAATRIYCVVTPTAGSVQALYRGVEALRRLGLGDKLHYLANKMRDGVSLGEPMSDLNGSLAASIPYDPAFDLAENRHQPLAIGGSGATLEALSQLASSIYPALQVPAGSAAGTGRFAWFGKRRRAG